ncbi:hypothetical protein TL16_g01875 [Triparma laevis f. inornata]|uniref:Uncharacterized protein n=1 Tax=Triparma laevis f. inornata TaxID=1714386 RepID=A0A9W6ZIU6_9STRA|nr:hypothetical protein TL16_g01875 [Triparma laevis f. inornata]
MRAALFTGKSIHLREGVQKVMKEFTQASMKSKKDAMHGVEGQSELVSILIEYLTAEFKLKQSDNPAELPNVEVLAADLSYPKTPMMHALDFCHTELANCIKTEISKASKKMLTVTSDPDDTGEDNFDRSALAKQRLMAEKNKTFDKRTKPSARPIVDSSSMLSNAEKAQLEKFSAKINK